MGGLRRPLFLAALLVSSLIAFPAAAGVSGLPETVQDHLEARGIDPSDAIVQQGAKLYAGPACPGAGWDCVSTAAPVVQVASGPGALAVFECTGDDTPGTDCSISQVSDGTPNIATCVQGTVPAPVTGDVVDVRCDIYQENTTGSNTATVGQVADQRRSAAPTVSLDGTETAIVEQVSGSGANTAAITQSIAQLAESKNFSSGVTHFQETRQFSSLQQTSDSGDQDGDVTQTQNIRSEANRNVSGAITQHQNDGDDDPDAEVFARQNSASGLNDLTVNQTENLRQEAKSGNNLAITQAQGSQNAGLYADLDGDSDPGDGDTAFHANQSKEWRQSAITNGPKSSVQIDPEICCILGTGATYDLCDIVQGTSLIQSPAGTQEALQRGRAIARENCTLDQTISTNAGTSTNHREGTFIDDQNGCETGSGCDIEHTEPPSSELHQAVRNVTTGQSFGPGDEDPSEAEAFPGEAIEYRFRYHNHGAGPAHNVLVTSPVPDHSTFTSCSAGCTTTGTGPGSTITWDLDDIAAGGSADVTLRIQLDVLGFTELRTEIHNTGTVDTSEEQPKQSNQVTVTVICLGGICPG